LFAEQAFLAMGLMCIFQMNFVNI